MSVSRECVLINVFMQISTRVCWRQPVSLKKEEEGKAEQPAKEF